MSLATLLILLGRMLEGCQMYPPAGPHLQSMIIQILLDSYANIYMQMVTNNRTFTNAQYTFMVQEKPNLSHCTLNDGTWNFGLYVLNNMGDKRLFVSWFVMLRSRYCFTCFMRWAKISRRFCQGHFWVFPSQCIDVYSRGEVMSHWGLFVSSCCYKWNRLTLLNNTM